MTDKNGPMGNMADMMANMMGGNRAMGPNMGMAMMDMMAKMMPQGLAMMLEKLPKDQRLEFAKEMVAMVVDRACEGLTENERNQFFDDLIVEVRPPTKSPPKK